MNKNVSILATVGVIYGLYYSMKNKKELKETAMYALGFGLAGGLVGFAISRFYER